MKFTQIAALLLVFCCAAPAAAFVLSYDENGSGVSGLPVLLDSGPESEETTPVPTMAVADGSDDPASLYTAQVTAAVDGVSGSLASAGNETGVAEVVAFPLITDPDLADPVYLGYSMGVKVVVVSPADGDHLQNTLWWYERDATTIVRALYDDETMDPPGFVAVVFKKAGEDDTSLKFILNAADASALLFGTNGTYIRNLDWSEAEVSPDLSIADYEPPGSAAERSSEAGSSVSAQTLTADALKAEVATGTTVMNTKIDAISRAAEQEDYASVADFSDDLIGLARDREKNLQACTAPEDCAPAFSEYCAGLRKYEDAGSLLWYGATFENATSFADGNGYLVDGQAQVGSALENLSLSAPTLETPITTGSQALYPGALDLEGRYKFKTASEGNTISVKVGPVTRLDQYFTKTADDTIDETLPSYGKEFFCVLVEINHLGYGGKGSQTFRTPQASAFTLLLNGEKYLPEQPAAYMEGVGSVYSVVTLNRKDRTIGYLVYEVPDTVDRASAYLQVDLGTAGGSPIWKLG